MLLFNCHCVDCKNNFNLVLFKENCLCCYECGSINIKKYLFIFKSIFNAGGFKGTPVKINFEEKKELFSRKGIIVFPKEDTENDFATFIDLGPIINIIGSKKDVFSLN